MVGRKVSVILSAKLDLMTCPFLYFLIRLRFIYKHCQTLKRNALVTDFHAKQFVNGDRVPGKRRSLEQLRITDEELGSGVEFEGNDPSNPWSTPVVIPLFNNTLPTNIMFGFKTFYIFGFKMKYA